MPACVWTELFRVGGNVDINLAFVHYILRHTNKTNCWWPWWHNPPSHPRTALFNWPLGGIQCLASSRMIVPNSHNASRPIARPGKRIRNAGPPLCLSDDGHKVEPVPKENRKSSTFLFFFKRRSLFLLTISTIFANNTTKKRRRAIKNSHALMWIASPSSTDRDYEIIEGKMRSVSANVTGRAFSKKLHVLLITRKRCWAVRGRLKLKRKKISPLFFFVVQITHL